MKRHARKYLVLLFALIIIFLQTGARPFMPAQQAANPDPPDKVVKLIFIHHSTGENWLTDDYGNLGKTLDANNYFVSDTNYGWGPDAIGDRTDIPNWLEWFSSSETPRYMDALFNETEQHSSYTRNTSIPVGRMRSSCSNPASQIPHWQAIRMIQPWREPTLLSGTPSMSIIRS